MKKRLVLALLLCAMVCALFTVTSLAAESYDHTSHEGWTELTSTTTVAVGGKYYLAGDVTLSAQKTISGATICLNGHTINAPSGGRHFYMAKDTTTVLCDCTANTTKGYIDGTTHLWVKGDTVPTGGTAYDLKGGIITGGTQAYGGAIYCEGTLILDGVNFAGNKTNDASKGGGGSIFITASGALTMRNTRIVGNVSARDGGGLVLSGCTGTMSENSVVAYNTATNTTASTGGGILVGSNGTLTLNDCSVDHNTCYFRGGGIGSYGTIVINNGAVISDNVTTAASGDYVGGGGIYSTGVITMNGGAIKNNMSHFRGGGVRHSGTFTMNGGEISGNKIRKNASGGMAVYTSTGTFNLNGGEIKNNTTFGSDTSWSGGALYAATDGIINMNGGSITGNTGASYGGVYVQGKFNMNGGEISGNSGSSTGAIGIWKVGSTAVTITGGTIKNNTYTAATGFQAINFVGGGNVPVTISGCPTIGGTIDMTDTTNGTLTITGGIFMNNDLTAVTNVSAKLDAANYTQLSNGAVVMASDLRGVEIYRNGELVGTYADLKTALNAKLLDGDVVKMVKDYTDTVENAYIVNRADWAAVVDMNGHSITVTATGGKGIRYGGTAAEMKIYSSATAPGVIHANGTCVDSWGGLQLDNIHLYSDNAQTVNFDSNNMSFNETNRIEDCVIGGGNWYAIVLGYAQSHNTKITLKNTTVFQNGVDTKSNVAIGGRQAGKQLKLEEGVYLYSKSTAPTKNITVVAGGKQLVPSNFTGHTVKMENIGVTATGLNLWSVPTEVATYAELAAALENSKVDTIKLTAAVTDNAADVTVKKKTLDLNGKELTVNSLIATGGDVTDSTNSTGKLVVGTTGDNANAAFDKSCNTQLAVGDADGFWFTDSTCAARVVQLSDDYSTYAFNVYIKNPNAKEYLINNPTTAKLGATTGVTIDGERKTKAFNADVEMEGYGNVLKHLLQNPSHGLMLHITGLKDFTDANINAWILTNNTDAIFGSKILNPAN